MLKLNDDQSAASKGASSMAASSSESHPTLVQLREEGGLRCGVPVKQEGLVFNQVKGGKERVSVKFCKATAAVVLGPKGKVELIEVTVATCFTSFANQVLFF